VGVRFGVVDYLLFSLNSMTTVGTSEVGLKAGGQLGQLMSSIQTVLGTVLLGLFGFVLSRLPWLHARMVISGHC